MKSFLVAAAAVALVGLPTNAYAIVVNFDDLTTGGGTPTIANGYGGMNWNSNWLVSSLVQPPYGPHSGSNYIFASFTRLGSAIQEVKVDFLQPVIFDGFWATGNFTVSYNLYFQGSLVSARGPSSLSGTPIYLQSGYTGRVDQIGIVGRPGYATLDDFTFANAASSVPEPVTWTMMIAGLGLVGGAMRRRTRVTFA